MADRTIYQRLFSGCITGLAAICMAATANATLVDSAGVTLLAPGGLTSDSTPINVSDPAPLAMGIHPGDGSNIGTYMLSSEFISFKSPTNALLLHIAAGDTVGGNLVTGYLGSGGVHAQYDFTGLGVQGATIIGFNAIFSGLASPTLDTDFITLLSPTSLSINLDDLIFKPVAGGQSFAGMNLEIDLLSRPLVVNGIPEPGTLMLALSAIGAFAVLRRTQRGRFAIRAVA